jgi:molybdopterin-guanine dinucleotide biosynthesis protein A
LLFIFFAQYKGFFFISTDLILISHKLISRVIHAYNNNQDKSIFVKNDEFFEPTFSIYKNELIQKWYFLYQNNSIKNFSIHKLLIEIPANKKYILSVDKQESIYLTNFNTPNDINQYLYEKP